jgi:hypothetical protein
MKECAVARATKSAPGLVRACVRASARPDPRRRWSCRASMRGIWRVADGDDAGGHPGRAEGYQGADQSRTAASGYCPGQPLDLSVACAQPWATNQNDAGLRRGRGAARPQPGGRRGRDGCRPLAQRGHKTSGDCVDPPGRYHDYGAAAQQSCRLAEQAGLQPQADVGQVQPVRAAAGALAPEREQRRSRAWRALCVGPTWRNWSRSPVTTTA